MAAVFMIVFSLFVSPMGGYERNKKRFKDASSSYLFFFRHAIDVALRDGAWDEAERYSTALEGYLVEPWPHCEMVIERGRLLAAYGRGERNPKLAQRIEELREECRSLGLWAPCFEWVFEKGEAAS